MVFFSISSHSGSAADLLGDVPALAVTTDLRAKDEPVRVRLLGSRGQPCHSGMRDLICLGDFEVFVQQAAVGTFVRWSSHRLWARVDKGPRERLWRPFVRAYLEQIR